MCMFYTHCTQAIYFCKQTADIICGYFYYYRDYGPHALELCKRSGNTKASETKGFIKVYDAFILMSRSKTNTSCCSLL